MGDPIEAHALAEALCANRSADAPLPIGSIKTNLGHLETAAGIAGLLKAMLVLKHGQIPPSLHFSTPNPHIDFEKLKLRVPTAARAISRTERPSALRASTHSDLAERMLTLSWLNRHRISQQKSCDCPGKSAVAGDAFRAFGNIAPDFSGESERVGEGTRQCQWQLACSAGSYLHTGSPAEPSPASVDSRRFRLGRTERRTRCVREKRRKPESPRDFHTRVGNKRRASVSL